MRVRVVAGALLLAVAFALSAQSVARVRFGMGDFKAFYCSARVMLDREDPYDSAPLARCEAEREPWPLLETKKNEVLPAPLPGYAIAAFVPFTLLPFRIACIPWLLLLFAATAGACALLARCGVAKAWTIAVALAFLVVQDSLPLGELPPIALFGLALAVWGAMRERSWAIALGVAISFSEPQIGAAIAVAALGLGRRYALPAIAAGCALALLSLATLGLHRNLEYVNTVLPAHVVSELPSALQFSLSAALYQLGAQLHIATLFGRLSWLAMLLLTFCFARSAFAKQHPEVAFLAAPAFVVVGGPFLHFDHIALAVPAALWLAFNSGADRSLRVATLMALVVPPLYVFAHFASVVFAPLIGCWIGKDLCGDMRGAARVGALSLAALMLIAIVACAFGVQSHAVAPAYHVSASLAQRGWSEYIAQHLAMSGWVVWLVKAPTWFGILATASAFAFVRRQRKPELALA